MRLRTAHPHQPAAKINVTPLIDVVMVLIIFYLIVGNLAYQRLLPVNLPEAGAGAAEEAAPTLVITVAQGPSGARIVVEDTEIAAVDLPSLLRARVTDPATASVHIRADRALSYSHVAPVIAACREAGLLSVKLVAQRAEGVP
ncbi:Biopolymer transport protein ExbD [Phycisphaerales bacterium]|nr:Biopolymer transport protein ExbD [Phycisphaerales bacterium]